MSNVIAEANWKFHWRLTESAGIMVYLAEYRGRRVLWEGSLPYVTVDHQRDVMEDEENAPPTHGPWWVPLGCRTLVGNVRVQPFRGGVELTANFAAGPYHYMQLWRFHDDGRMAPWLTIHGGGLHGRHTYHPHWRFDFDLDGAGHDALEAFTGEGAGGWQRIEEEGWFPSTGDADDNGYVWRQIDFGTGSAVNLRPHQWDDAELYAVRYHDGEWAPFSPRSEAGSAPFPAAYVGREPLEGQDVQLWYVAHVHYDQAFPYTAGPWIKLEGFGKGAP